MRSAIRSLLYARASSVLLSILRSRPCNTRCTVLRSACPSDRCYGLLAAFSLSHSTKAVDSITRRVCRSCTYISLLLPAGVMLLVALAALVLAARSTLAATHKISVGAYANGTQANTFDPASLKAAVGDMLERVDTSRHSR